METERRGHAGDCPFLMPGVSGSRGRYPIPVYCRLPNGRVRVPSREQLVYLCSAGQHHDCPGYRRWTSREPTAAGWPDPQ